MSIVVGSNEVRGDQLSLSELDQVSGGMLFAVPTLVAASIDIYEAGPIREAASRNQESNNLRQL